MIANIFKKLPLGLQHARQAQRDIILQFPKVPEETPEYGKVCGVTFAPALQRRKLVEIGEPEGAVAVPLPRFRVHDVHESIAVPPDLVAAVTKEVHPLRQHGVHFVEIQLALRGVRVSQS